MPQFSVDGLGWISAGGGKTARLLQNKQKSGCDQTRAHQARKCARSRTHTVAHLSLLLIRCSEMWQLLLWSYGRSSMSHRCFQRTRYSSGETVITLQLQIKISLEGCNTKCPNSHADPLTLQLKKVQSRAS